MHGPGRAGGWLGRILCCLVYNDTNSFSRVTPELMEFPEPKDLL